MSERTYISPILARHGAVAGAGADDGVAWHYGDPTAEQRALARGAAVVDLSHYNVVTVSGPDRLSWLHSISTAELTNLPTGHSTELLILTAQGHIEHSAGVVDDGETTWLITEPGHGEVLAAWLNRMKFMLRVEIADVTGQWAVLGEPINAEAAPGEAITWRDPWPEVVEGGTRYGLPTEEHPGSQRPWRLVLVPRNKLESEIRAREATGWILAGTWASEALRVEAWRPRLGKDVDHKTIPHELDWLRTAVHLHKGCYRGQESIARVHNLGRPPRRLVMLHLDGSGHILPDIGADVTLDERVIGTVTSVARHHEIGPIALALVKRNADAEADVQVSCEGEDVPGGQEVIVPPEGESVDRPGGRGATSRDARSKNNNLNGALGHFL